MLKRWIIQASVVSAGALVTLSTLRPGSPIVQQPLVQQLSAGDSAARVKANSLLFAGTTTSGFAPLPVSNGLALLPSTPSKKELDLSIDHARIDFWVNRLTTSMANSFKTSLTRMAKYSGMINDKLDDKEMPKDLIYLALIESNFNPNARSRVQAVGLWQFMKATAKQYGLSVGKKVDERKDPTRSTDAALTYLSMLHDRFGSWYLAAAAYNSGEGTVRKALKKETGKTSGTDEDFFRIMRYLPKETQDYVPKLIAAARVGNDPARYGLVPPQSLATASPVFRTVNGD